ncbi:MAG: protein kinase domain-containing protein [bacterium]
MNHSHSQADRVASILQSLGEAYLTRGQYAEAVTKFTQLLQTGQRAPAVHRSFALALAGMNQWNEPARQAFQHVLQLFPDDRDLLLKICRVLLAHNAREAFALQLYKRVLTLNPAPNRETLHALVQHFLKNEEFEPAFETLKRVALLENGDAPQTVTQLVHLGWRLEKYAEIRTVLEYLNGRNEKMASVRHWLALESAYAIHRANAGQALAVSSEGQGEAGQIAAPHNWQTIVQALSAYGRVEYVAALREFSSLRLALALIQQSHRVWAKLGLENEAPDDTAFALELAQRFSSHQVAASSVSAARQILALKIINFDRLATASGAELANALTEKFIDFSVKYLVKAANATCYRLRDGVVAFADSLKLLAIAAVDLLHKIERYNVTAKPATQIWVQTAVHARTDGNGEVELSAWRMLYEVLHMLEIKTGLSRPAMAPEKQNNSLIVARTVYEKRIGDEAMPAKYSGLRHATIPFFHAEICEAIWRNPLEYVQEKTPQPFGKYAVTEKLRGSRAAGTYRARDRELERVAILKALSPHNSYKLIQDPALREQVTVAVRHLGRLALPGVAMIYDMGWQEEIFFFVREFLEGKSLDEILHSGRCLLLPEGLALGMRLCRILHASHRAGVYHGNLKPGNIWLSANGEVKVSDFFVPLFVDLPDPNNLLDPANWQYSAPERRNGATLHATSDVFSFGAILCESMSGKLPLTAEEGEAEAFARSVAPDAKRPPLHPVLAEVIARACHAEALERFQSFAELEAALRRAMELLQKDQEISFDEIARLSRERRLLGR